MSIQDAYREAKAKMDKNKLREDRLKLMRAKQDKTVEFQKKIITAALEHAGVKGIEACLHWSFGPDYGVIPMNMWIDRWNRIHGNIFKIWSTDAVEDSFFRIGMAYMKFVIEPALAHIKGK